uniref:Uncharacterized protein n=1 Tax=Cacopsylla melanoneura TaxID=428564 RepID=A0A8D8Z667_9HEMI
MCFACTFQFSFSSSSANCFFFFLFFCFFFFLIFCFSSFLVFCFSSFLIFCFFFHLHLHIHRSAPVLEQIPPPHYFSRLQICGLRVEKKFSHDFKRKFMRERPKFSIIIGHTLLG